MILLFEECHLDSLIDPVPNQESDFILCSFVQLLCVCMTCSKGLCLPVIFDCH